MAARRPRRFTSYSLISPPAFEGTVASPVPRREPVAIRWRQSGVRAAVVNVAARGLTLFSKLALTLALARLLTPEEVGLFNLITSALAILVFALGLEYHYFTIRELIEQPFNRRAAILRDQFVLHATALAVALPLFVLLSVSGALTRLPQWLLPWLLVLVVLELFANEAGIALVALARPVQSNVVLFIRSGIWVYVAIGAAALWPEFRRLPALLAAWTLGASCSLIAALWFTRDLGWRQ